MSAVHVTLTQRQVLCAVPVAVPMMPGICIPPTGLTHCHRDSKVQHLAPEICGT